MTAEERALLKDLVSKARLDRVLAHRQDPTDACDHCGTPLPEDRQINRRFCNKTCSYLFNQTGVLA